MFTLLGIFIEMIFIIYLAVTIILFLSFSMSSYKVTITNTTTQEKQDIDGIKKYKYFLLLSLLWPITAKFKE